MAEILSLVATPILEKLIDKAWDAGADAIHSISQVGYEIKRLSSILQKLKIYFKEAEKVQTSNADAVDSWLEDLKEAAYDAEDILDLFATKSEVLKWKKEHNSIIPFAAHNVGHILFKKETADAISVLLKDLDKIFEAKDKFIKLKRTDAESSKTRAAIKETGHAVDTSAVVGREDDKNKTIKALTTEFSDKLHVVPILGIGGVGKTTLAQLVFNDKKIGDHFVLRMWVCATDFDLHRILREIIVYDDKFKNDNLADLSQGRLETLASEVLSKKRVLLVLDDVWTVKPRGWNSLKGVLQQGGDGSRVLVTSRVQENIKMMDNFQNIEPLGILNFRDSSELFWRRALVGDSYKDLQVMGKEIIEKCKGLPLVITAIAGSLRGKGDVKRWMEIVKNDFSKIEKQCLAEGFEILPVLKVSFDHLPSYLKPCFLLCSLFPKGHSFDKIELVKIWMAEGYIPLDEDDKPEELGNRYFVELCDRSFFLWSNVSGYDRYTIHDLFHEMAVFVSGGNYLQLKDEPLPKVQEKNRHISLLGQNIENPTLELTREHQKVRTILIPRANLRNFGKILDDLFHHQKYIRVLDLSSSSIDKLPDSVKELQLLRYLDLSRTGIRMLPNSICDLWNLQTLRLLHCLQLHELPKDLAKLISLRHLELDDIFWYSLSELPAGAGHLTNLQNLNKFKFWVRKERGYRIEEIGSLQNLTGQLHLLGLENVVDDADTAKLHDKKNLNRVVYEWSKKDKRKRHAPVDENRDTKTLDGLKPHSNVKEFQIINFGGSQFPAWFTGSSLRNLTTISLNHCTNCKILPLGLFPELNKLYLKYMPELEVWERKGNPWPKLQTLKIIGCPKLRILPEEFEDLWTLEIKECGSLENLPATPSLIFLSLIGNYNLRNWNEKVSSPYEPLDLKIKSCPNLTKLPEVKLSKLDISDCDQLRNLPPLTNPESLKHLALDTSDDGSLLTLIPHSDSLESLVLSNISALSSLICLPLLLGLKALYIQGCKDLQRLWIGDGNLNSRTPGLKFLSIKNCPKLEDLPESGLPKYVECLVIASCAGLVKFGPDVKFESLISLKDLYIENCRCLKRLPKEGFPSSLKHLKIVDCPLVEERYKTVVIDTMVIPDRKIEFVNRTNVHEPEPQPEPQPETAVALAGEASSPISPFRCLACCRILEHWCCLM